MKRIREIRGWMAACDAAGIGDQIPREVRELEAYACLLEARIIALDPSLLAAVSTNP